MSNTSWQQSFIKEFNSFEKSGDNKKYVTLPFEVVGDEQTVTKVFCDHSSGNTNDFNELQIVVKDKDGFPNILPLKESNMFTIGEIYKQLRVGNRKN